MNKIIFSSIEVEGEFMMNCVNTIQNNMGRQVGQSK